MFVSSFGPVTKTGRETAEERIERKLYLSLNATDEKLFRFSMTVSMSVVYEKRIKFSLNFLCLGVAGHCGSSNNWHFLLCPLVETGNW